MAPITNKQEHDPDSRTKVVQSIYLETESSLPTTNCAQFLCKRHGEGVRDPKRTHILHGLDILLRSLIRPQQISFRREELVSRSPPPEQRGSEHIIATKIWNHTCNKPRFSYSLIELRAMEAGIFPKMPSIIARCSRFSCVWNVASPVNSSSRMHPTLQMSHG
jgi:hypothetical protein